MQIAMNERRQALREPRSEPVLICSCDPECHEEVCMTLNVSKTGLYFSTAEGHYFPGMNVIVTPNFRPDDPTQEEYMGDVVRLDRLDEGKWGVAIRILMLYSPGLDPST
jgi:hypothetical protein